MRFFSVIVLILFNIYLVESANRTESENFGERYKSEISENVRRGVDDKSDSLEHVFYEDYEYDDKSRKNSVLGKSEKAKENSTEIIDSANSFPNEVFLTLRNITADGATAFKSFTNRNDVVDLQASASDNLNVTSNSTLEDAESAGFNLRALRDAAHLPQVIDESGNVVHLPYKHTKIDTADLSDCALQGEWKPMGVAHSHLHVSGDNSHQAEILQSVGSYAVYNKEIPHWQQNVGGENQNLQNGIYNHKPSGLYAGGMGGNAYGSNYGYGSEFGSGFVDTGTSIGNSGVHSASYHYQGGSGGVHSAANLGQFQKIKAASVLSRPPFPPIILGKKPGYWKLPKTKHKFFPGKGRRPGFSAGGSYSFLSQMNHEGGKHSGAVLNYLGHGSIKHGGGVFSISGSSGNFGHNSGNGGFTTVGHGVKDGTSGLGSSGHAAHGYGGGVGGSNYDFRDGAGGLSSSGGSNHGFGNGRVPVSEVINHGYGSGDDGSLTTSGSTSGIGHIGHGVGGGAVAGHLTASSEILPGNSGLGSVAGIQGELSSGGHALSGSLGYIGHDSGNGVAESHRISPPPLGSGQTVLLVHNSGNGISAEHLVGANHGGTSGGDNSLPETAFLSAELNKPSSGGSHYQDSTFSSSQISQGLGNGNSLPDASFLSSHINQDFAVNAKGISDDLSASSTFTCGKNHDHNTNYHTATFQVADHDHPSSVDVLQYGGDAAVLIKSGDNSFHDQILPERKHYKTSHLSDAEVSGSENRNELVGQAAQLTSQSTKQESGQIDAEPIKLDDGEEPERHSYYHEITKVTKIPATSVGSVEYTFSKYETKPQTFSTESETIQEEPEVEQPQIIRELEHLSNKFQLDLENPQKLFEDPPSQELAYHYPFQDVEHHHEPDEGGGNKKENHEGITEFPYQFYHNPNKVVQVNKKPIIKHVPRPGKPHFHQKIISNLQPKLPVVVLRKHKPKQFLKKQNYEVHEHSGERHRPIGEIFPPQKFPKQFHNPKPNFAVDRPKNGWRPNVYQEYKYDHSHGKKVKKFKTKAKIVAPILIRRPVSPAPVIRVVEVTG